MYLLTFFFDFYGWIDRMFFEVLQVLVLFCVYKSWILFKILVFLIISMTCGIPFPVA